MKRREFTQLAAAGAALAALGQLPARAQGAPFKAGADYRELEKPVSVEAKPPQIEVIEFFSYICPFCKNAEPDFEAWKKAAPKDVAVRRVHVGWNMDGKQGEPLQRIYYSLNTMGQVDALQAKVFNALQTERKPLDQPQALFAWVAQQGLDRAKFEEIYNSFGVATEVRRAVQVTDAYGITGTPSLAIGGRYYTDGDMARSFARMLAVTDALIDRERKRLHG